MHLVLSLLFVVCLPAPDPRPALPPHRRQTNQFLPAGRAQPTQGRNKARQIKEIGSKKDSRYSLPSKESNKSAHNKYKFKAENGYIPQSKDALDDVQFLPVRQGTQIRNKADPIHIKEIGSKKNSSKESNKKAEKKYLSQSKDDLDDVQLYEDQFEPIHLDYLD
jgi:hypothetical protein